MNCTTYPEPFAERATFIPTAKNPLALSPVPVVMIIDGELWLVTLLKIYLARYGVKVRGFDEPQQAIEWYEAHQSEVSLVLLNMKCQTMGGEECFCQLRGITSSLRIALMSHSADRIVVQALIRSGALVHFQKPFYLPDVIEWVLLRLGLAHRMTEKLPGIHHNEE